MTKLRKAIIFGSSGQDGQYLQDLLAAENITVIAVSTRDSIIVGSVGDYSFVSELIKTHQPEFIFHLAAKSSTRHDLILDNHEAIVSGTVYILEAVKKYSPHTKCFLSGSGLQFVNEDKPIKETDAFDPNSAYSLNRIQSVQAARYYRGLGIQAYVGYFFNHDSVLRPENHMAKRIITAVKKIAKGSKEKILIGDLHARKEWGFAGDMVKAIWTLVNQDKQYEATIGTGMAYSILDWINKCFSFINENSAEYIVKDDNFQSPYKILVSNPETIFSLGWQPQVEFEQLAKMLYNDDRYPRDYKA